MDCDKTFKLRVLDLRQFGVLIPLRFGDNSASALMSPDSPKRSAREILERIIPSPSGDRDKLHPDLSGFVFSLAHYQQASLYFY